MVCTVVIVTGSGLLRVIDKVSGNNLLVLFNAYKQYHVLLCGIYTCCALPLYLATKHHRNIRG